MTAIPTPAPARGARTPIPLGRIALGGLALLAALGLLALLTRIGSGGAPAAPAPIAPIAEQRFGVEARGRIVPVEWARVSSTEPGRITQILVREGATVGDRQEIARLDTGLATVSLLSPFRGTVTSIPIKRGENVLPAQTVAFVGDLTRFQVETTDLDEFGIARVQVGQGADLLVGAIPGLTLRGRVVQVALMGQTSPAGDVTFPVLIDFDPIDATLRWGMTVRVRFDDTPRAGGSRRPAGRRARSPEGA